VGIDRSTAYDWIGIVEDFSPYVGLFDIKAIDWGKLRKLRRVVREHPEQAAQWLAKARTLSRNKLNEELKKQMKPSTPSPSKRPISKLERDVSQLQRALSKGDLDEGVQALRAMLELGQRLLKTLEGLSSASEEANPEQPIWLGWRVLLLDKNDGDLLNVYIVPNGKSDIENGQISEKSPVGAALLSRRVGEEIEVQAPGGVRRFRILYARPEQEEVGSK